MSVATSFKFAEAFPICPPNTGFGVNYDDNVSVEDAMAFYWNIENFSLTLNGSITWMAETADLSGTLSINPAGFTGSAFTRGSSQGLPTVWFGDAFGLLPFASWPQVRQPNERVCSPFPSTNELLTISLFDSGAGNYSGSLTIPICSDPVNEGKYIIALAFYFQALLPDAESDIIFSTRQDDLIGYTMVQNPGILTIGPFSFEYYSGYSPTGVTFGGTGTVTSALSYFTYP